MMYTSSTASCSGWTPPNSTAMWWLMAVNEKLEHGGGRSPEVGGEDHSATESRTVFTRQMSSDAKKCPRKFLS